jgi:hypothetical protein
MSTGTVRPGSFCAPEGGGGSTSRGTSMVCSVGPKGGRARWRGGSAAGSGGGLPSAPDGTVSTVEPIEPDANAGTDQTVPRTYTAEAAAAAYDRIRDQRPAEISDADLAAALHHPSDGYNRERLVSEAARRMYPPSPDDQPVSGERSQAPLRQNTWGEFETTPDAVHYHDDGVVGQAIRQMGPHRYVDVDGEPVANAAGRIATDVDLGHISPQEGVERMARLRNRMPADSPARHALDHAVSEMGAPNLPAPPIPATAPEPVRRLIEDLHRDFPIVRRDGREIYGADNGFGHHSDGLLDVVNGLARGDREYSGTHRFLSKVREAALNVRHESNGDRGKRQIDHRVQQCVRELEALAQADRKAFYPPDQH